MRRDDAAPSLRPGANVPFGSVGPAENDCPRFVILLVALWAFFVLRSPSANGFFSVNKACIHSLSGFRKWLGYPSRLRLMLALLSGGLKFFDHRTANLARTYQSASRADRLCSGQRRKGIAWGRLAECLRFAARVAFCAVAALVGLVKTGVFVLSPILGVSAEYPGQRSAR